MSKACQSEVPGKRSVKIQVGARQKEKGKGLQIIYHYISCL